MTASSPSPRIVRTELERLYCGLLAADAPQRREALQKGYESAGDLELWSMAEREGCSSIVGFALLTVVDDAVRLPSHWSEAATKTAYQIKLYLEQLDRVARTFDEEGISLVALKNSGIARGIHRDLAGCPMGDIDVLVSPRFFRRAHAIMKQLGFELGDRSPFELADIEEAERHGGAEYRFRLADGSTLWFELQWRPVAGRWIRPDQEPPADELIARSVAIDGTAVRLLAPEDNLLQVCLHTAKHSYVRAPGFRLHTDVDRIVRRCPVNWEAFVSRVERIGVRTAVYLALLIPSEMLGTPVPAEVLARLDFAPRKHGLMIRWLQRVGFFNPKQKKWSKSGYIVFNLLLYDTWVGIWQAIFPDYEWMRRRHAVNTRWALPWGYARRAFELLFRRTNT